MTGQDWGWEAASARAYSDLGGATQEDLDIYRGVGATVERGASLHGLMEAAGLNWRVEQSAFRYGDRYQYREEGNQKAVYRGDNGMLLDVVGADWMPHQNGDMLDTFERFCNSSGLEIEHIGELKRGKIIFAVARTDSGFSFDMDGDQVNGKIIFTGSHELGRGHRVDLMTLRRVCGNGLVSPVRVKGQVISHIGEWDTYKVMSALEAAKTNFAEVRQTSERLASVAITVEEATLHLIKAFGDPAKAVEDQPKIVQTCLRLFQGQAKGSHLLSAYNTAWGLLNSVTEYYNHHARATDAQSHLSSLWQGNKANQQQRFLNQVVSVYAS